ncbi:hypothetical protein FSP39_009434 [Pinctada imbricata]|uniref:NADH dehydrogenase [ubiquinone] 1 alpha subcomplex assembly factor 4 n=1 Tax=Pinctada imbricata TaxID=66713 RepID=A0AA88YI74_PINIB|nr:hypothetical protein FSP39_009434 [Pinctada imbricata]
MGAAMRVIMRPIRNFNIENRAHRHLDKMETGKPQPAPKHKSAKAKKLYDDAWSNPDESLLQKDEGLASKLKTLEVKTIDPHLEKSSTKRPLPEKRPQKEELLFGIPTPKTGKGKINIKEVMDILSGTESDLKGFSVDKISKKYNLDPIKVQQILTNYGLFKTLDFRDPKQKIDRETQESQEHLFKAVPAPKKMKQDNNDNFAGAGLDQTKSS